MGMDNQRRAPAPFPRGKKGKHCVESRDWRGAENLASKGNKFPVRPSRSESL